MAQIHDPDAERREAMLQQLVREYRQRHGLNGLAEVIRIKGEPTIREQALREFAEQTDGRQVDESARLLVRPISKAVHAINGADHEED